MHGRVLPQVLPQVRARSLSSLPAMIRNFRFAFRLRTNIPSFASARDFFLHSFQSQRTECVGFSFDGAGCRQMT